MTEPFTTTLDAGAPAARLRLMYFAWVRERIGRGEEEVVAPASVRTVNQLVDWLVETDPDTYAYAFENRQMVRVAVDRRHVGADAELAGAQSVAFFPPMTGG